MKSSAGLIICLFSLIYAKKSYNGYQLLTVRATNQRALTALQKLSERSDLEADFWNTPLSTHSSVTIAVHQDSIAPLRRELLSAGLEPTVTVNNVQDLLDDEEKSLRLARGSFTGDFSLNEYHRYAEISDYLDGLGDSCSRCQVMNVGESFEGRNLKVLKIRGGTLSAGADGHGPSNRKAVWIDAGIHAREWISPATALNLINKLVNLDSASEDTIRLMDSYDWYILPSFNPDGYEYTWTEDRLWRKTRSTGHSDSCVGVDANRNWKFHWMEGGASADPCSNVYAGPRPFSEVETKAVSRFLRKRGNRFLVYLSIHAYSQIFLTPWGYTEELPIDYSDLERAGNASAAAIRAETGKEYTVGSAPNLLYVASGSSMDWTKGVAGIKYSMAVELRDRGEHGFLLPSDQIQPQGHEMWTALKAMMGVVHSSPQ